MNNNEPALEVFEDFNIRRVYDEQAGTWVFSVVDVVAAPIQPLAFQTARTNWNKLKERQRKEGSQSVTNCHRPKLDKSNGCLEPARLRAGLL